MCFTFADEILNNIRNEYKPLELAKYECFDHGVIGQNIVRFLFDGREKIYCGVCYKSMLDKFCKESKVIESE